MSPLLSLLSRSTNRRAARNRSQRPPPRRRLTLERLEDRTVPTAVAPPPGLVSWWTGDNTAADLTGGRHGTLVGGTTYAPGMVGQAFRFDGIDDTVVLPGSYGGGPEATLEAWVKTTGITGDLQAIVSDTNGSQFVHFHLGPEVVYTDTGEVNMYLFSPLPVGVYQHVALSIKSGDSRLYVNGSLVGTSTLTFSTIRPTSSLRIGSGYLGGRFFKGDIDEVSYYNRALTATEVQAIYSAGSNGKVKSPSYIAADFPGVAEGPDGSASVATFTIRRVGSLAGQATVNWETADGTATAGTDYVAASGQVVFQDGESQKTVQVSVTGDDTPEATETFWLVLSTPTPGYAVGGGLATVADDDVGVSVADASASEGSGALKVLDRFVAEASGGLARPRGLLLGPDGNQDGTQDLYVASCDTDAILRYDGVTGAFLDAFVPTGRGGLDGPLDLAFGPDGNLYVSCHGTNHQVLRYDGSGAFLGVVASGLSAPHGLTFGPDGSLYIANQNTDEVLRYHNSALSVFISAGSGGLDQPRQAVFGPDGNGDGAQDLYVASQTTGKVLRYDGRTGAFLGTFATTTLGPGPYWLEFGTDGYLYTSVGIGPAELAIVRFDAVTGAFVDSFALGRASWSFILGPGNVVYSSSNASGSIVDRLGPSSLAAFTVRLSSPSSAPVTVAYATADGTAVAGSDYVATSGTLTFAPGQTTRTVLVRTINNTLAQGNTTFFLNLSNPVGALITDGEGTGTITDDDVTKFFVVNDGADRTYRYGGPGNALVDSALGSGNTAPRGAASNAVGDKLWVADVNKKVYVYGPNGNLLGSWTAGSLAPNAQVEGIATNGTDVWIVDARQDRVFRYTNAAGHLSGSQNAASSFNLNSGNSNPKGIVTDGTSLWVVDDSSTDKVFKYTLTGTLLGSWTITAGGGSPTGITLDPTAPSHLWIVDNGTDRVYQYDNAVTRTSGSQTASATFALAAGNTNPQDIADPPPPDMLLAPVAVALPLGYPASAALPATPRRTPSIDVAAPSPPAPSVPLSAGWRWESFRAPADDSEFLTPGDQGEQGRIDLLTVLMHEMGHLLGHDHDDGGVMMPTLLPGVRLLPGTHEHHDDVVVDERQTTWIANVDLAPLLSTPRPAAFPSSQTGWPVRSVDIPFDPGVVLTDSRTGHEVGSPTGRGNAATRPPLIDWLFTRDAGLFADLGVVTLLEDRARLV